MYYRSNIHKQLFERLVNRNPCRCPNDYLAVLYLLTAEKELWISARKVIQKKSIDIAMIKPPEFNERTYSIYSFAQDIYLGETHISIKDLCNKYVISNKLFELFLTAIQICRTGYKHLDINKVFN